MVELNKDDARCHLRVVFPGYPALDYQAARSAAAHFAAAARPLGVEIVIDSRMRANLPPLPCERLWWSM